MKAIHKKLLLIVLTALVWGCTKVPITDRKQLALIPSGQMLSMSAQSYNSFKTEHKVVQAGTQVEMVRKVGSRIQMAVESYLSKNNMSDRLKGFNWEFNVVEDPTVNAWCMPGGKVVFYTGIMPVCIDEAGIAVVMGHEVAHAIAEHGNERMTQQLMVQGALTAGSIALSLEKDPKLSHQLLLQSFGIGSQLGMLAFSRKHEAEADELGLMFMAMAGYDPAQAPKFWERMKASSGGGNGPSFMSTHPSHDTRIQNLNKWMPKAQGYYSSSIYRGK